MGGKKLQHAASLDPTANDIPHAIDIQAIVDILNKFYPQLDADEIKRRLMQVMQGHGSLALVPSESQS